MQTEPGRTAQTDQRRAEAAAKAAVAVTFWSTLAQDGLPEDVCRVLLYQWLDVHPQLISACYPPELAEIDEDDD